MKVFVKIMRSCTKNHHFGLETWKHGIKQFMATALTNNLDSRLKLKHLRSQLKVHIFVSFSCVWPPMVNTQILSRRAWPSRQLIWYALWRSQEPKELFLEQNMLNFVIVLFFVFLLLLFDSCLFDLLSLVLSSDGTNRSATTLMYSDLHGTFLKIFLLLNKYLLEKHICLW